jgi:hypothetical protein
MSGHHEGRAETDTTEEIRAYIKRLMATRPEPTPSQIQTVRDLLPPAPAEGKPSFGQAA